VGEEPHTSQSAGTSIALHIKAETDISATW
jgi:hypothetical protein